MSGCAANAEQKIIGENSTATHASICIAVSVPTETLSQGKKLSSRQIRLRAKQENKDARIWISNNAPPGTLLRHKPTGGKYMIGVSWRTKHYWLLLCQQYPAKKGILPARIIKRDFEILREGETMRLSQLEPQFLKVVQEVPQQIWRRDVHNLSDADGIMFLCPKCFQENNGPIGTHRVVCWFRGKVSDEIEPKPGRWTPQGTGIEDLTFIPGNPPMLVSVLFKSGCGWHGLIQNGEATTI